MAVNKRETSRRGFIFHIGCFADGEGARRQGEERTKRDQFLEAKWEKSGAVQSHKAVQLRVGFFGKVIVQEGSVSAHTTFIVSRKRMGDVGNEYDIRRMVLRSPPLYNNDRTQNPVPRQHRC